MKLTEIFPTPIKTFLLFLCLASLISVLKADLFQINADSNIFGEEQNIVVENDNLNYLPFAEKYDLGYQELKSSNPNLDLWRLKRGDHLFLGKQFLFSSNRAIILINLSTMRLYYPQPDQKRLFTYPIGIGRNHYETPIMETKIIEKEEKPIWVPTSEIRYEFLKKGIYLPKMVKSSPANPLGYYSLRLAHLNTKKLPVYLIHETNDPYTIGTMGSSGCIHLFSKDAKELFSQVSLGTIVKVIRNPCLFGIAKQKIYAQIVNDPSIEKENYLTQFSKELLIFLKEKKISLRRSEKSKRVQLNWSKIAKVIEEKDSLVHQIGEIIDDRN